MALNTQAETGYRVGTDDLKTLRKRVGACKACGGFVELSRDQDYRFVVAKCVPCGREAEVPNA